MAGEQIAFRRTAVGVPIAEYARLMDRARVGHGGMSPGMSLAPLTLSVPGAIATGDGVAHTKGAWVELVASTAVNAESVQLMFHTTVATDNTATGMLVDIGIGAAAAETVWFPDLLMGYTFGNVVGVTTALHMQTFIIPKALAAGSRISARLQGSVVSDTMRVSVLLRESGGPLLAPTTATAYGVNAATSGGTLMTTAGSTNTKAAWTELTAATTADISYLMVAMAPSNVTALTANDGLVDIGIGAAASEVAIISDLPYVMSTTELMAYRGCEAAFFRRIPAGTRISARYQSSSTATSARPTVAVYGLA